MEPETKIDMFESGDVLINHWLDGNRTTYLEISEDECHPKGNEAIELFENTLNDIFYELEELTLRPKPDEDGFLLRAILEQYGETLTLDIYRYKGCRIVATQSSMDSVVPAIYIREEDKLTIFPDEAIRKALDIL